MSRTGPAQRPEPAELHEAIRTLDTIADVAAYFGVSRTTIFQWQKRPEFLQYLDGLNAAAFAKIRSEIEADTKRVARTARRIADDEVGDPHAALNAGRLLLELHGKAGAALPSMPTDAQGTDRDGLVGKVASLLEALRGSRS
jgi:hypothetical protein